MSARRSLRVVLVDDSELALEVLQSMLRRAPDVRVVGTALDGEAGLALAQRLRPDVLVTDLHMPGLDGLGLARAVMSEAPTPILVASVSTSEEDVFRLLGAGAVDVYLKPDTISGPEYERKARELVDKVRVVAGVTVFRRRPPAPASTGSAKPAPFGPAAPGCTVAIGASTGGPQALRLILGVLPKRFPVPVLCVQHIAHGFLEGLVDWLRDGCDVDVKIADDGEQARPGTVYFAPDHCHLLLERGNILRHDRSPPVDGHLPSVTTLFSSVAKSCGEAGVGILLTGMGRDGAEGLHEMRTRGALTIAQDASTSLVHGMPAQAIARGAARHVLPLPEIATRLRDMRLKD